jgi:hypothetical protein
MAVTIKQLHKVSNVQTNEHRDHIIEATLYFKVLGVTDEAAALSACRADTTNIPTSYNGCLLNSFRVVDWMGVNGFEVEAQYKRNYGNGISSDLPDETEEFHASLQGIHIAYSKYFREKSVNDSEETSANFGHQIEPTEDGINAVGCDAFTATGQLVIRHCFRTLSRADEMAIEALLNHVNDATFRGRPAGTLLFSNFDKVEVGSGADAYVECTYSFSYMPNGTAKFRGATSSVSITKAGWEYAWAQYYKSESTGLQEVLIAYAEGIFDTATFSQSTLKISAS